MATANAVVRARVNEDVRDKAAAVLDSYGLTISDVIRMTLTRVAVDRELPFELNKPNAETRAAMDEVETLINSGERRFRSAEELFDELDGDREGPKQS